MAMTVTDIGSVIHHPRPQSAVGVGLMRLRGPTRSIALNRGDGGSYLVLHWRMRCCVEGSCEELDWGWDAELVGEEEQEVVLTSSLLLGWSILNLGRR